MAKKKDQQRIEELEDLKAVMSTGPGGRLIQRLLRITGPYRSVFDSDPVRMAFMEGNRNFGCRIVSDMLEACPEQYVRLIVEANQKQEGKEAVNEQHKSEGSDEETAD